MAGAPLASLGLQLRLLTRTPWLLALERGWLGLSAGGRVRSGRWQLGCRRAALLLCCTAVLLPICLVAPLMATTLGRVNKMQRCVTQLELDDSQASGDLSCSG